MLIWLLAFLSLNAHASVSLISDRTIVVQPMTATLCPLCGDREPAVVQGDLLRALELKLQETLPVEKDRFESECSEKFGQVETHRHSECSTDVAPGTAYQLQVSCSLSVRLTCVSAE